jgi:hypothetical protein
MEDKRSDKKNSVLRKNNKNNKKKRRKLKKDFDLINWFESNINKLSPEIISLFLDNIIAFEKEINSAKRITVYELMNKPSYRKSNELRDDEVEAELNIITALLLKHQIVLETLCKVPKQELYRFITEELFFEEINDVVTPGLPTHFTYEEFHPNHISEIKWQSFIFLIIYFDRSSDTYKISLSSEAAEQDWHIHFRKAFQSFEINDFTLADTQYDIDLKEAHVDIKCDIMAMLDGSGNCVYFKGNGKLHFVYENDCWCVNSVELPAPQTGSIVSN